MNLLSGGNVDNDPEDNVNIVDLTFIVSYLFTDGQKPPCMEEGNVDGDANDNVNIVDLTTLVQYLFNGGSPPRRMS